MRNTDVIIIGAGPAGMTAAIYARRYGLNVLMFENMVFGGQVVNTPTIENYPGIDSIGGADLSYRMYEQTDKLGAELVMERIVSCDLKGDEKKIVTENDTYTAKAVIIANGAVRRKLGVRGEKELSGRGVSYCATCDGAFFKGKKVAIVGGGNTSLEDAMFLANMASEVHLIHRRDSFRGNKILVDALTQKENIKIHYTTVVESIEGDDHVTGITLKNTADGSVETVEVEGVFVAIGLEPDNKLFADQIALDEKGYILADEECRTSVEGVFAAGDTRKKALRQIVTAVADGAIAAFGAANMLSTYDK